MWLAPSPDFNRLADRRVIGGREIVHFFGSPEKDDRWSRYRLPPLELGARLLQIIDAQGGPLPRHLRGPGDGMLMAGRS